MKEGKRKRENKELGKKDRRVKLEAEGNKRDRKMRLKGERRRIRERDEERQRE